MSADNSISLNKFISQTGICSRREADKWIEAGRVKLNGAVAQKGNRVLPNDTVLVDNHPILTKPKAVYLALHKPPGITCTTDRKDKTNIVDFVNYPKRIFPIGRLDKPSTGLILLTNNGDIVNDILRAENNHEKEYIVTVNRPITSQFVKRMSGGLPILGTKTKRCKVERLDKFTFKIVLTQGLNRQIRRMCAFLQYQVVTLKRVRIMHIHLGHLKVGKWRYLTAKELITLEAELLNK
ncbi:MAG: pseudouridine synthase [Bacteroidota bacterium]